jgi:hypothetical protein
MRSGLFLATMLAASSLAAAEAPLTIDQLLAQGWEIAGYASGYANRTSLILFRHPGVNALVQLRRPLRRDARSANNRQLLRAAVRPGVTHRASVGLPFSCSQPGIHGETVAAWGVGNRRRRAGSSARTAASRTAARPELLVPLPVVALGDAPVSLQYVGSWVQV